MLVRIINPFVSEDDDKLFFGLFVDNEDEDDGDDGGAWRKLNGFRVLIKLSDGQNERASMRALMASLSFRFSPMPLNRCIRLIISRRGENEVVVSFVLVLLLLAFLLCGVPWLAAAPIGVAEEEVDILLGVDGDGEETRGDAAPWWKGVAKYDIMCLMNENQNTKKKNEKESLLLLFLNFCCYGYIPTVFVVWD